MVSFSNADSAGYDSVNGQSTVPSKTIQMDVKIPVQPSNFDAMQKGALLGAPSFIKHNNIHNYQRINQIYSKYAGTITLFDSIRRSLPKPRQISI